MVDLIKLLVKFIKIFIFLDKSSDGAISKLIADLEEKYLSAEE